MNRPQQMPVPSGRNEFSDSLRKGLLLGAAVMLVALPPKVHFAPSPPGDAPPVTSTGAFTAPAITTHPTMPPGARPRAVKLADFRGNKPSRDVRQMANWVVSSGDHRNRSFVIVDKKDAKVYVFDGRGRLREAAPALLGEARGDDSAPGIGDKPLSQVLPQEKTTPAGRFIAEIGMSSTRGEDVVWVDYDAAVSMHRVLKVKERLASLASATKADNRMSFGCINLPTRFYENVLRPSVAAGGAVIYVLPETRPLRETFASFFDVTSAVEMAQR